jgi:hypothetical protein
MPEPAEVRYPTVQALLQKINLLVDNHKLKKSAADMDIYRVNRLIKFVGEGQVNEWIIHIGQQNFNVETALTVLQNGADKHNVTLAQQERRSMFTVLGKLYLDYLDHVAGKIDAIIARHTSAPKRRSAKGQAPEANPQTETPRQPTAEASEVEPASMPPRPHAPEAMATPDAARVLMRGPTPEYFRQFCELARDAIMGSGLPSTLKQAVDEAFELLPNDLKGFRLFCKLCG